MEIAYVRNRLRQTLDASRERARERRQRNADAERAFESFLARATPVATQLASAAKAEGYPFTVSTPERSLRFSWDRGRSEFVDLSLDTSGDRPEVIARVRASRGSRTIDEERPLKPGAAPDAITDDEVLEFLLGAIEPWTK